ncbi:serine O-acetyltransferase [Flammeovirga aprica]|uniref:Serine acetyltransferase n=1 Tax=Flammeovirga aprica JL-4 TaxID=694437 RepID=A0A7X9XCW2_9BACT|nr:DapH/DapD/GlmU-related protein [Flammeovirga aprica]NME72222.1 serine acetyltransferase [Flammeovirga aprica JL-4]
MKNTKGEFVFNFYRLSHKLYNKRWSNSHPIRILYKIIVQYILCIDIPDSTMIGDNFQIYHGFGIVINEKAVIGRNVTIRQNTTIGNSKEGSPSPKIGNNVNIGANCIIIGDIKVGNNVIIGAGSVVTKNVPENTIIVGNPAKIIKHIK